MTTAKHYPHEHTKNNQLYISKLSLTQFRNYDSLTLQTEEKPIVLTGKNGAGKTNILEAISFLSPGRGLRSVKLQNVDRINEAGENYCWAVSATIQNNHNSTQIGTGRDPLKNERGKRIIRIDGTPIKNQAELAESLSVMWLTPQMDGLFIGAASDRRKFLDRLVYNFDPEHASRVYSYEYSMRERIKLLQNNGDNAWLNVLETKMAERAIAIAIARKEAVEVIQSFIHKTQSPFPKALIAIEGEVENMIIDKPALMSEQEYARRLYNIRSQDAITGRTGFGIHKSDMQVIHAEKHMHAASCSTGEQKAMLLSIIMAEARAKAHYKQTLPILLLDEVVAHLDEHRREYLFEEFISLGTQVWMTGTDTTLFSPLKNKASFYTVHSGTIET